MKTLKLVFILLMFTTILTARTFQVKRNKDITYQLNDNSIVVTSTRDTITLKAIHIKPILNDVNVWETIEPYAGSLLKYKLIHKSKNKYLLIEIAKDTFTNEVERYNINVNEIVEQ